MFNKKKKGKVLEFLKEEPLGYWEEKSYMIAIPKDETRNMLENIFEKINSIDGVQIKRKDFSIEQGGEATLIYDKEEYEVGFYVSDFAFHEMLSVQSYYFSEKEMEDLRKASKALTVFMKFNKDAQKSYHLQLKLIIAMVPDLLAILDESAEKLICSRWAKMAAESKTAPGPNDMYLVQAVSDEKGEVWLHTHGLCRCGVTELEILQSDKENYNNHYNLITTFASRLLDKKEEFIPKESSAYIGRMSNDQPIVVTYLSWVEGLKEYKNPKLGGVLDRKEGHNSKTGIIFIYKNEYDEENRKVSRITEYNSTLGDNPIYFLSNEETARMKKLAIERFKFVKEQSENKENKVIIKIGLHQTDDENEFEHIWFELMEFDGEKFKAKLLQEPYFVKNMHQNDEGWYTVEDVTDWVIYTPKYSVTPNTAYLLT